jgi:seryl-tRNA synthetase
MIDIKWVNKNPDQFDLCMKKRGANVASASEILNLYERSKEYKLIIQNLNTKKKELANDFFENKQLGSKVHIEYKMHSDDLEKKISEYLEKEKEIEEELHKLLSYIPNVLADDVPIGESEEDNKFLYAKLCNLKKTSAEFHMDIAMKMGCVETTNTVLMSGSRFITLKKGLARLHRALINFMLNVHTQEFGFTEVLPPLLVKNDAMYNAGQLPKFDLESFLTTRGDRLIPTSEVPLVNLVANELLNLQDLPIRYTTATNCFRSEAGSAGKDTRGMIRLHQFSKVELVSICAEEQAEKEHSYILNAAETILQKLELPYRVILLCSADTPFTSKKTYDIEVWMPSKQKYVEISSCSQCGQFQARRLKTRYKDDSQVKHFVNTLNGTGIAIERTLAAILETYYQDNTLYIPKVLQNYLQTDKIN